MILVDTLHCNVSTKNYPTQKRPKIDEKIKELFAFYNKHVLFAGLKVRKISGKDNYLCFSWRGSMGSLSAFPRNETHK